MKKFAILLAFILSACSSNYPSNKIYTNSKTKKYKQPVVPSLNQRLKNVEVLNIAEKCPMIFVLNEIDDYVEYEENQLIMIDNEYYRYDYLFIFSKDKNMVEDFQKFNIIFKEIVFSLEYVNQDKYKNYGEFWESYTNAIQNDENSLARQEEFVVKMLKDLFEFSYMESQKNDPYFNKTIYPNCDYSKQKQTAEFLTSFGRDNFEKMYTPLIANKLEKIKEE